MKFGHTMAFEHFPFMVHRTPEVMRHMAPAPAGAGPVAKRLLDLRESPPIPT